MYDSLQNKWRLWRWMSVCYLVTAQPRYWPITLFYALLENIQTVNKHSAIDQFYYERYTEHKGLIFLNLLYCSIRAVIGYLLLSIGYWTGCPISNDGNLSLYNTDQYVTFSSLNECIPCLVQSYIFSCISVCFYTHRCLLKKRHQLLEVQFS